MKVWVGSSKDFVSGKLLDPLVKSRRLTELRQQRAKKIDQLAALPAEIQNIERDIRALAEELYPVFPGETTRRKT